MNNRRKRILKSITLIILISSLFSQPITSQTTPIQVKKLKEANETTTPPILPTEFHDLSYPLTPDDQTFPSEPQLALTTTPPLQSTQEIYRTSDPVTLYVDDDNIQGPWDGTLEHPYRRIQQGLNAAHPGDTIYVFSGIYHEYFSIDLPDISLLGEEKHTTIIDGDQENFFVIWLNASGTHLSGFTIKNNSKDGWWWPSLLIESDDNSISDNIFTENNFGIGLRRWAFYTNERNIIERNLFITNDNGLGFFGGSNNTIKNNSFVNNVVNGLFAYFSYNNSIINNTITRNFIAYGAYYGNSNNDVLVGNLFTWNSVGLRGTFLSARISQNTFRYHQDAAMSLWDLAESTISENIFSGNAQGIECAFSSVLVNTGNIITKNTIVENTGAGLKAVLAQSRVSDNILIHNAMGIQLSECDDTRFSGNTLIENDVGLFVNNTRLNTDNSIYYNNFMSNTLNAFDDCENNTWDNGTIGNYWSNYTGVDEDENGIGDTPYNISGGKNHDQYPTMNTCGELCASIDAASEVLINEPVHFLVFTGGGASPYSWEWDFGDGDTSTEQNPLHPYTAAGAYIVSLRVTDNASAQYTISHPVIVKVILADTHGPYQGVFNDPMNFIGSASGGVLPYTWVWDFDDGGTSTDQNPVYTYSLLPSFWWWPMPCIATLTVTDGVGNNDTDITWVLVDKEQVPPTITLKKPEKALYIDNRKIIPLRVTIVIRSVEIEVNASDDFLYGVKFFVDNEVIGGEKQPPFICTWDERNFKKHQHTIRITAVDIFGNQASVEFPAWKFL
jgi:parallel beta-helix repeat protein